MNTGKLYEVLQFVENLDRELGLQAKLTAVLTSLSNLANQPAHPNFQSALAQALDSFTMATEEIRGRVTPAYATLIAETGGSRYFNSSMADEIKQAIEKNPMTPAVARDRVQELHSKRDTYMHSVSATRTGLQALGVRGEVVSPGEAEMAFLMPREIFKNHLGPFAKELNFINRLISNLSELIEGHLSPVEVRYLSSSVPTIALTASLPVMYAIGEVVNKFLDAWKKVEEIREVRERVRKLGVTGKAFNEFTEKITATVKEVVEAETQLLANKYLRDEGRTNELVIALNNNFHRLFAQIERGLVIEIRSEPPAGTDGDHDGKATLIGLRTLSQTLRFPPPSSEPLLLVANTETDEDIAPDQVNGVIQKCAEHRNDSSL